MLNTQSATPPRLNTLQSYPLFSAIRQFCILALLFIALAFIGYLSTLSLIKIDLDVNVESEMQILWANELDAFSGEQSTTTPVKQGRHSYWLWINNFNESTRLRIDPVKQPAIIKVYKTKLYALRYFPVELNLITDAIESNEIKILHPADSSQPYIELQSLGGDPQIDLRIFQRTNPFIYLVLFALITLYYFRKKTPTRALLLIFTCILLSYLLSFNATSITINALTKNPEKIKLFWREANQKMSTTRAQQITVLPGENHYDFTTANLSNIDVLYLEASNNQVWQGLDHLTLRAPGFKATQYHQPEIVLDKQGDVMTLAVPIAVFLGVFSLFFLGILYYLKRTLFLRSSLLPKLIKSCFLYASLLVFSLAWQSDFNIHPDESSHIESTKYYSQYWLPPSVGDPRALDAYQHPWASSRLDDLGISYFFAGKFSLLVNQLFADQTFIYRAFNALLFLLLFLMVSSSNRLLFFLTPLLCTPQIWYLYAYANRGGFVLFVSLLLAWQLVNKKSSLQRFLQAKTVLSHWHYALFPGALLGILSIEQTNYLLFILFVFSLLLWELLFLVKQKKVFIYKCLFFLLIAVSLFCARHGLDNAINGSHKLEQRIAYAEQHAAPDFKPSIAETEHSYPGLRLKAKGITLPEIFQPEWSWHKMTFKSFTGFYGYYAEYSPKWYYTYILLIYGIVLLLILQHALFKASWQYKIFTALCITAIAGGLLMSILFSWLYDFQPQGRYIFPIIPIILVYFWKMFPLWNRQEQAVILTSAMSLILLSFYSFREVALHYLFS